MRGARGAGGGRLRGARVTTLRGTGVSPGIAVGPALIVEHEAGPVFRLVARAGAAGGRGRAAGAGARRRRRAQLQEIKRAAVARGRRAARLHLRRAPADAERPAAAGARGRGGARAGGQRRVGAADGVREPARALRRVQRRVPARAQHGPRRRDRPRSSSTCAASPGAPSLVAAAGAGGAGGRGPAALGGGRARLGPRARDRRRTSAPRRTTPRSSRARSGSRPWPGSRTPRAASRRAARSRSTAGAARWWSSRRRPALVDAARGAGALPARGGAPARHARPAGAHDRRRARRARGQRRVSRRRRRPRSSTAPRGSASSARSTCSAGGCASRPRSSSSTSTAGWSSRCTRSRSRSAPGTSAATRSARRAPRARTPRSGSGRSGCCTAPPSPSGSQLRALLRAGAHGPVRIMFPFVSGPGDLRRGARAPGAGQGGAARGGQAVPRGRRRSASTSRCRARPSCADLLAARGRLLQRRHQRPDPVPAGRRPHRPARQRALRPLAPGCAADAPRDRALGRRRRQAAVGLRRDGRGAAAGGAARRARLPLALDGALRDPAREGGDPRGERGGGAALAARCLGLGSGPEIQAVRARGAAGAGARVEERDGQRPLTPRERQYLAVSRIAATSVETCGRIASSSVGS